MLLRARIIHESEMGYDIHITRKKDWFDDEPSIELSEWLAVVDADPEMRHDGFAEAVLPSGGVLRTENEGLSVWTAYSRHGVDGNMAWFDYRHGNVIVKNPDDEILRKMWILARRLEAKVQGDKGESYDENGNAIPSLDTSSAANTSSAETSKTPWWKIW